MALKIAQLGQPALWQKALDVPAEAIPTPEFRLVVREMLDTLAEANGVGLAGPQVYVGYRVFLAMVRLPEEEQEGEVEVFINPRIVWTLEEQAADWEGCLSFPELMVLVRRPRRVRVEYLDLQGQPQSLELDDLPARIVQHEYDHLDGILTLDRADSTHDIVKASELEAVKRFRAEEQAAGGAR
jgi:peptide deformylase